MSASSSPFGLRVARHISGFIRPRAYKYAIANAYATTIYNGEPVILSNTAAGLAPQITAAGAGTSLANSKVLGAFAGVEYLDVNGKPTYSPHWVASTALYGASALTGQLTAYVFDDPEIEYEVQASGPLTSTQLGLQFNLTNIASGTASTGLSTANMSNTAVAAAAYGHVILLGAALYPDNNFNDVVTDGFTIARVKLVAPQLGGALIAQL